jgi:flagellar protein FlaG
MNVINFMENFNSIIVTAGNGFHGEKVLYTPKPETISEQKRTNDPEEIKKSVEELNRLTAGFNEKVQFSLDHKTNRVIIKVMDRDTNEVISEIPGKYSLRLLEQFRENMGLFIDESR